jgi:hypothetical protein
MSMSWQQGWWTPWSQKNWEPYIRIKENHWVHCQMQFMSAETRFREIKDMMSNTTRHMNAPWESVTMNFITKLLTSKNSAWGVKFDSILTIVDRLTKYTMFISFKKTTTASVLMYIILQELINNHGLSKKFITDRDKLFTSKFWETLTAELRINHKMLTAYHSQMMSRANKWTRRLKRT